MIEFDISDELKTIVSEFGFEKKGIIKITFTEVYDKISLNFIFTTKSIIKSFDEFEKRIKKFVPKLSLHHFNLIENIIYNNLKELEEEETHKNGDNKDAFVDNKEQFNSGNNTIKYQRKYELDSVLYEAIIVDKLSKFVSYNQGTFSLVDKIEVANYTIYPADTLMTHNPIPYFFKSEEELKKYLELATKESWDSLFEKILTQVRKYINATEHTLVIIASDILYSYFQNKFGTTHYNIFVGDNNSGKNSALLVIKILGYRPFYVTSASPANYYTFLGDVQEGEGIILEDEADNIGKSHDKKNIFKSGYCSGGSIPKVGFTNNGSRYQDSWLTFSYKCITMEELPDYKSIRGILDRSFVHHFFKGDVDYNIKEILKNTESELYQNLVHIRKLLLAFKLLNYNFRFPEIQTNLDSRNAELTHFILRMFKNGRNFEKIRIALSKMIYDKTHSKNNSIEAKILETLRYMIEADPIKDNTSMVFSNEQFEKKFKELVESKDNPFDILGSTFYLPDGTKVSKYRLSQLLKSKFDAKPERTNQFRGYSVLRENIEKLAKQYDVIEEIIVYEGVSKETHLADATNQNEKEITSEKKVTEVTQVTEFKDASPSFSLISDTQETNHGESKSNRSERSETNPKNSDENKSDGIIENEAYSDNNDNVLENKTKDMCIKESRAPDHNLSTKIEENNKVSPPTPSKCVTSVTSVTAPLPQYPCYFCGTNYMTSINFDMELHLIEFHKQRLLRLPVSGNLEKKIEWAITETKRRMFERAVEDQKEDDEN